MNLILYFFQYQPPKHLGHFSTIILKRDYDINISPHGVHNILSGAGLLKKHKKNARRQYRLDNYPYKLGEVMQLDVKHWKHAGYQYDIIICCTRIKFKMIFEDYNVNTTVKFLEYAIKFYKPAFDIELVQMGNGTEFTNNQIHIDRKKEPPLALPEKWLIAHNIGFRHIPPSSPHLNGCIERPHGMLHNMTPVEFLQSLAGYKNAEPDFSVLQYTY